MIRDVNNIQGALNKAAGMGRGGDNQIAHVGAGEVMIPPEVIDGNPQVMAPLIKAFQKAGMDWRRYLVGSEKNSKNPKTGAREFYVGGGNDRSVGDQAPGGGFGGDRDGGGRAGGVGTPGVGGGFGGGGGDIGGNGDGGGLRGTGSFTSGTSTREAYTPAAREAIGTATRGYEAGAEGRGAMARVRGRQPKSLWDAMSMVSSSRQLGKQITADFRDARMMSLEQLREAFPRTYGTPPFDRGAGGEGDNLRSSGPQTTVGQIAPLAPQPLYLEFAPGMTPLQQRTNIATMGLNSDDSRYQTPETQEYYKSLVKDELSQAGTMDALMPIERQYLEQVLGLQFSDFNSLMAALG